MRFKHPVQALIIEELLKLDWVYIGQHVSSRLIGDDVKALLRCLCLKCRVIPAVTLDIPSFRALDDRNAR
tara:strand:- start:9360 stop:9569 length:210 start_codon:yes stop_codon:yes gene_type:complete